MSVLNMPGRGLRPRRQLTLPLGVVGGAILASYYLSQVASGTSLTALMPPSVMVLLAAILGLAAAAVILRWPWVGVAAVVAVSLAVPFTLGTGTATSLNATAVLIPVLAGLWALRAAARHEVMLAPGAVHHPLLALGAVALLAFAAGLRPWLYFAETAPLTAQLGGLAIWLMSLAAFLLMAHLVKSLRALEAISWLFCALGAFHVAAFLVPEWSEAGKALRGSSVLGSMFWTWLVALSFSQAAFNVRLGVVWRVCLAGLTVGCLYVGLGLQRDWSSGWLPPLFAIGTTLVASRPRLSLAALPLFLGVLWVKWFSVVEFTMGGDNQYSLTTRLEAWRTIGQIVSANPVTGLGFANYYWYSPYFPIIGYDPASHSIAYAVKFNSHNNYVDIVAQTGAVGLLCFVWLMVALATFGWQLRKQAAPGFPRAYVYGALGGLGGTLLAGMLGDWVLPFVYNIGFSGFRYSVLAWLFLGGLVVIHHTRNQLEAGRTGIG